MIIANSALIALLDIYHLTSNGRARGTTVKHCTMRAAVTEEDMTEKIVEYD